MSPSLDDSSLNQSSSVVVHDDFHVFQTIRRQLNSKLTNQAVAAKTLLGVEAAMGDSSRSPVAYFGLLVS
jgi:hypothetical protein